MSEEKLYAVKNDEGKYWDFSGKVTGFWDHSRVEVPVTGDKDLASALANAGGHVVAFVEEPEKVVVSPEEAKLVKNCLWTNLQDAFLNNINLLFRGRRPEDVTRLKSALTNGYTVAKDKRYLVGLDGLVTTDGAKQYLTKKDGKWFACRRMPGMHQDFTDDELKTAPKWAQQLDREEVTDDDD
ncbi:hypothetical protein LacP0543_14650 [Lactobacillus paracasei subsp. tolerans]|uniref:hypothetical protein n=1 Tax=Lacticaseibacillus paracasei TaxID=1597 RepID=UPI00188B1E68|nr:hypothetical protein [Lacticaseibacillus paracasei]MBF4176013.1 hypothetical protein [Lacticaseibacillus paracasei subsp. tolerans]